MPELGARSTFSGVKQNALGGVSDRRAGGDYPLKGFRAKEGFATAVNFFPETLRPADEKTMSEPNYTPHAHAGEADGPEMSTPQTLTGIFLEPTRTFEALRARPRF